MLENRPAAFLHWFALNGLGASVVPLIRTCARRNSLTWCSTAASASRSARRASADTLRGDAERMRLRSPTMRRVPPAPAPARSRRRPVRQPSAPCSTPPARPASRRAACCPTTISCAAVAGTPRSADCARCARRGSADHAAADDARERDGVFDARDGDDRRLHHPARPVPSAKLVADGARQQGDDHAQPGRDADDAAGLRSIAGRSGARRAVRLRTGRRSALPRRVRGSGSAFR